MKCADSQLLNGKIFFGRVRFAHSLQHSFPDRVAQRQYRRQSVRLFFLLKKVIRIDRLVDDD